MKHNGLLGRSLVQFLVGDAVTVLPITPAVIHALEGNFMVGIEFEVGGEGVALAFTGDVVLSHLGLV